MTTNANASKLRPLFMMCILIPPTPDHLFLTRENAVVCDRGHSLVGRLAAKRRAKLRRGGRGITSQHQPCADPKNPSESEQSSPRSPPPPGVTVHKRRRRWPNREPWRKAPQG